MAAERVREAATDAATTLADRREAIGRDAFDRRRPTP
jgi:hypothetical protein